MATTIRHIANRVATERGAHKFGACLAMCLAEINARAHTNEREKALRRQQLFVIIRSSRIVPDCLVNFSNWITFERVLILAQHTYYCAHTDACSRVTCSIWPSSTGRKREMKLFIHNWRAHPHTRKCRHNSESKINQIQSSLYLCILCARAAFAVRTLYCAEIEQRER